MTVRWGLIGASTIARQFMGAGADVVPIGLADIPACGGNADVLAHHGLDGPSIARTVIGRVGARVPAQ